MILNVMILVINRLNPWVYVSFTKNIEVTYKMNTWNFAYSTKIIEIFIDFFNSSLNAWYKMMKNSVTSHEVHKITSPMKCHLSISINHLLNHLLYTWTIILISYISSFYCFFPDILKLHILLCTYYVILSYHI